MSDKNGGLDPINPGEVRYIKLGPGGTWENTSLDGGRLDWDIGSPDSSSLELETITISLVGSG